MQRKIFLVFFLHLLSISCFAKPSEPEWFKNYRTVYPNSEYLAQRGSGTTAEDAKTDAIAQVSRYMKTSVNANLKTTITSISTDEKISEETSVVNDVELSSNLDLFGIETTESYYYKPEKKWYAVAYIVREDAWIQYKPKIEAEKAKFYGFLKKAEVEEDSFSKISLYKNAWKSSVDFSEKLEYGRIINPKEEEKYLSDRTEIAEVPSKIEKEQKKLIVRVNLTGDYGAIVETAIKASLESGGFVVGSNGNYTADVVVASNPNGNNPVTIYPSVTVAVKNGKGKALYSYEAKITEKTVAYTLENAQKKAFPKLADKIKKEIKF